MKTGRSDVDADSRRAKLHGGALEVAHAGLVQSLVVAADGKLIPMSEIPILHPRPSIGERQVADQADLWSAFHRTRLFAATAATLGFLSLGLIWDWTPGLAIVPLAVLEMAHAFVFSRRPPAGYTSTIIGDIVIISVALAIFRPEEVAILPAFAYLLAVPLLLTSGKRAMFIVGLAITSMTGAALADEIWPVPEWTLGRTALITALMLVIFAPLVSWLISVVGHGLADRERYRVDLERSERWLADIVRHAPIGMEMTRPDSFDIAAVNPALCSMLGYTESELLGRSLTEIVHPEDLEASRILSLGVVSGELSNFESELRYLRADGRFVWGRRNLAAVRGPDGEVEWMIGQIQDITDKREARQRRELLLELLSEIIASPSVDRAMEAVLEGLGRDGRWTFGEVWVPAATDLVRRHMWSGDPALAGVSGHTLDRRGPGSGLAGMAWRDRRPVTDADLPEGEWPNDVAVRRFHLTRGLAVPVVHRDEVLAVLVFLGGDDRRDESKRTVSTIAAQLGYAMGALLTVEERDRLVKVLENTSDLVALASPGGAVQWVNRAGLSLLGLSSDELVGKPLPLARSTEAGEDPLAKAIANGSWRGEEVVVGADGVEIPMSQVVLAHQDRTGEVAYVSIVGRDITAQKELEASRERLIEAKDDFIASISHELRTPLTAIYGFVEILAGPESAHLSPEEREELLHTVVDESKSVGELVEDLLVSARAEISQLTVRPECFRLDEVVASVVRGMHHPQLSIDQRLAPLEAVADPLRVRQIVRNLITNATRYGGQSLSIETIELGGAAVLRVADDGEGVPSAAVDTIFDRYTHAEARSGRPDSVGIGLSVSRTLARMMGGDVIYHRKNGWTVFELVLRTSFSADQAPSADHEILGSSHR